MHRARYLTEEAFTGKDDGILLIFTRNLATHTSQNLRKLNSDEKTRPRIDVQHLDGPGGPLPTNVGYLQRRRRSWRSAMDVAPSDSGLPESFYRVEWETVVQAQNITSADDYLAARSRRGEVFVCIILLNCGTRHVNVGLCMLNLCRTASLSKTSVLLLLALPAMASPVAVGSLVFGNPLGTGQGFEVVNSTGPADGCDAGSGYPVCTVLAFQTTSLQVTFADLSTATRTPSGGFAFGPGAYIYGLNLGDDLSNSFIFDPLLNIISATFSGTVSPLAFQITDSDSSGNMSTFFSSGAFAVSLDLSSGPPLAAVDITVDSVLPVTPEPNTVVFFSLGAWLLSSFRYRFRVDKSDR
jgi:hypothetical protein